MHAYKHGELLFTFISLFRLQWWLIAVPFALLIFTYDESRRWLLRKYKGGWLEQEFYY